MRRGTTPTITITCKDFDFSTSKEIVITIELRKEVNITGERIRILSDTITAELTQEETLSLGEGLAKVQVKVKTADDKVIASNVIRVTVEEILNEDIL